MRTIKLTKIKKEYALTIPESIVKLYDFRVGQIFNLEVKETNNMLKLVILTYATPLKWFIVLSRFKAVDDYLTDLHIDYQ